MNTLNSLKPNFRHSKTSGFGSIPVNLIRNLTLVTTISLLALSTLSGSFNAHARQQEQLNIEVFNNPQAILNVSFKDNVYLDNIVDNELNSNKNWQGFKFDNNTVGINGLSGLSSIGGRDEMITINGQYSPRQIKKAYKDKLQSLIVKIDDIVNNGSKLTPDQTDSKEQKESLDKANQELSKMNNWEVKKQRYFNFSQSKILNLSLVGNTNTLTTIKTILDKSGHILVNELTQTSILQSQIKELETKLTNKPEQEQKTILTDYITQSLKQSGETRSIEEVIKEEYNAAPEYIKHPIQDDLEEVQTKSFETTTSKLISELINGTEVKAALPAWIGSVTTMSIFLATYAKLSFFIALRWCSSHFWQCISIVTNIIFGANEFDDIRRKIFN